MHSRPGPASARVERRSSDAKLHHREAGARHAAVSDQTFGYNNDWIGLLPLKDDEEALLVVNHEYISVQYEGDAGIFLETFPILRGRTPTLEDMKRDVGVSVVGPERGVARQFASLPSECEGSGPIFAPRQQARFLSIQHPGERFGIRTDAQQALRGSNWPLRKLKAPPLPAVVAIRPV